MQLRLVAAQKADLVLLRPKLLHMERLSQLAVQVTGLGLEVQLIVARF
jgi:hypothetical protein